MWIVTGQIFMETNPSKMLITSASFQQPLCATYCSEQIVDQTSMSMICCKQTDSTTDLGSTAALDSTSNDHSGFKDHLDGFNNRDGFKDQWMNSATALDSRTALQMQRLL